MSDYTYRRIITDREGVSTIVKEVNVPDEVVKQIKADAIDDFVKLAKEHEFKWGKKDITNFVIGFFEFFAEQLKDQK